MTPDEIKALRFYLSTPFILVGTVFFAIGSIIAGEEVCKLMDKWEDQ